MLLKKEKKMPRCIIDDIEVSNDSNENSDEQNSDEKNSNKENSYEDNSSEENWVNPIKLTNGKI